MKFTSLYVLNDTIYACFSLEDVIYFFQSKTLCGGYL